MTKKHKNHLEKIQQQSLKSWGITDLNVKLSNKEVVNQIEELRAKLFLKTADSETALMVSNCLTDLIGDIEVEEKPRICPECKKMEITTQYERQENICLSCDEPQGISKWNSGLNTAHREKN